jgi:nicotinamidase-related amidase
MSAIVFGRTILTTFDEIVSPSHTAILIVDPQNDFLHPRGLAAQEGIDVNLLRRPVPALRELLAQAREVSAQVVYLQYTQHPDGRYLSDAAVSRLVRKNRASGFIGTNLDLVLRTSGIRTLVIAGVTTSGCVMYTARDAMMHDYYVVVPTDCIGSQRQDWHDATVLVMDRLFHYVGASTRLLQVWSAGRDQQRALALALEADER